MKRYDLRRLRFSPVETLVVTEDNPLAGILQLVFHPRGKPLVYVSPQILKCVVFLACKKHNGYKVRGTAFLMSQPLPGSRRQVTYFVTARHVIDGIKDSVNDDEPSDGVTHIRINTLQHGFKYVQIPSSAWVSHEARNIDVAVVPVDLEIAGIQDDHLCIPRSMFLSDEVIEEESVGPGDDLYFPGLFKHHTGQQNNVPILRMGAIAAMPGEPIQTNRCGEFRAYLAEARSIGGLSGSPVFLDLGYGRGGGLILRGPERPRVHLLGLVHGHFNQDGIIDGAEDINLTKFRPSIEPLNTGIAIIVPSSDIESVLDLPQIVAHREAEAARYTETERSSALED